MEIVGDNIPPPWGSRIEFVFREIGGFIWLQITLIVVALRCSYPELRAFGVYCGEATHLCEGSPVCPGRFAFFNEYRKL